MKADPAPVERPRWLPFLPRFLFRAEAPLAYILKAFPLVLLPSMLLSGLISLALPAAEGPAISITSARMIAMLVVGAPLIETLIMLVPLLVLVRLVGAMPAAVLSAIGWGIAHSLAAPIWGLVVWWPFLIFSILFVTWRERSLFAGFGVAAATHALQNSLPALTLLAA